MNSDKLVNTHKMPFPASPIYLSAFVQYTDLYKFLLAQPLSILMSAFEGAQLAQKTPKALNLLNIKRASNHIYKSMTYTKALNFPSVIERG